MTVTEDQITAACAALIQQFEAGEARMEEMLRALKGGHRVSTLDSHGNEVVYTERWSLPESPAWIAADARKRSADAAVAALAPEVKEEVWRRMRELAKKERDVE